MGRTTALRQAIKRDFVPLLQAKGYALDMGDAPRLYRFRKVDGSFEFECDVQWEKYGTPRFILNFSKSGPTGLITRGRLAPSRRGSTAGWFRQDRPYLPRLVSGSKLYSAEVIVRQLIALFEEVEDFWTSSRIGPHIRLLYPVTIQGPLPPLRLNRVFDVFQRMFGRRERPR
jgi:hypothetical protein